MSKRYIDADKLRKDVEDLHDCYNGFSDTYDKACIIGLIDEQPTADVVEVVRCKDCIYGIPTRIDTVTMKFSDERYCNRHRMCHFEGYYCADGKRKETEDATIHRC